MGGRWYRDSAKENINPALALAAAGGMGKAMEKLARIPLDIDDRRQKQQDLDAKSTMAGSRVSVAKINANAKIITAEKGLEGKTRTAKARIIAAATTADGRVDAAKLKKAASDFTTRERRKSNKNTYSTLRKNQLTRQEMQKQKARDQKELKKIGKSPTKKVTVDDDSGKTVYSDLSLDAAVPLTADQKKKQPPKDVGKTLGWW